MVHLPKILMMNKFYDERKEGSLALTLFDMGGMMAKMFLTTVPKRLGGGS